MTTTLDPIETSSDGRPAIGMRRFYTRPGVDPYSLIEWELRTAAITDESGKAVFEQTGVEVPAFWSQTATQVVASKYFRGRIGTPERESSAAQMVDRIVNVLSRWGTQPSCGHSATPFAPCAQCGAPSYFASQEEADTFAD